MRTPLLFITLSALSCVAQAQTVAGMTLGSFRATESGAAEYRIPIRVPPGIAGMEPKLALVYNSQAGNGMVGVGWGLEGLSAITRCPRSMAQDGVRGGVNYDWNDRYCLDGARLIAIAGGYGANGTEYRTELESFSKIVSNGVAGNGPASFTVWTKSGQILEYGNTDDSRIEAQGKPSVRVWAVNKIQDTKGNYLTVGYYENPNSGEYVPTWIAYSGNSQAGAATSAGIALIYEPRPDIGEHYIAGSLIQSYHRLIKVSTYWAGTAVRNYRLQYQPPASAASTGRSRLASLVECNSDETSCLAPTTFGWLPDAMDLANETDFGAPSAWGNYLFYTGDFDGDGKTDLLGIGGVDEAGRYTGGGCLFIMYGGTGLPYQSVWACNVAAWAGYKFLTGDFDGDGRTDVLGIGVVDAAGRYTGAGCFFVRYGGVGLPYESDWACNVAAWANYKFLTGDFDGDGRTDIVGIGIVDTLGRYTGAGCLFIRYGGVGLPYESDWACNESTWGLYDFQVGDFDGDGRSDLAAIGQLDDYGRYTGNGCLFIRYGGVGLPNASFWRCNEPAWNGVKFLVGDFDGDGQADLMGTGVSDAYGRYAGGCLFTRYGGVSLPFQINWACNVGAWGNYRFAIGDFNGDGRSDLVGIGTVDEYGRYTGAGCLFVRYGGLSLANELDWTCNVAAWWGYEFLVGDFNGDGKSDLLGTGVVDGYGRYAGYGNIFTRYSSSTLPRDHLGSVDSGFGTSVTINYKPLTDNTVYTREATAAYPIQDIQAPLFVVSSHSRSNGIGGTVQTSHSYAGAKVELNGRGFLGFRQVGAIDGGTGINSLSTFRQDFPYTGMPTQVLRATAGGLDLTNVASEYRCKNPANGADCAVAAGNRYFPFLYQGIENARDLTGAVLPTVTTTTQYDTFGNATSVVVGTGDGYSKTTTNEYHPADTASWLLGRLKTSTVQSTMPPP